MLRNRHSGLALVDLFGFAAVLAMVAAIGVPTLERVRESSKRMSCSINLKGLGVAGSAYAAANQGRWMVPAFKNAVIDQEGIDYLPNNPFDSEDAGSVGFERHRESKSETINHPAAGSTSISTTRAYWMLVRSGDASVGQFICASSLYDSTDTTQLIDLYYDFTQYKNISYGYLVPFGPPELRPREGRDSRIVFAADKGPWQYPNLYFDPYSAGPNYGVLHLSDKPGYWRPFNSPNHGGRGTGDGQNVLFADGRVEFKRKPAIGADNDNIYTLISGDWGSFPFNLIHGDGPGVAAVENPYPGQMALHYDPGPASNSTTDSLIFP